MLIETSDGRLAGPRVPNPHKHDHGQLHADPQVCSTDAEHISRTIARGSQGHTERERFGLPPPPRPSCERACIGAEQGPSESGRSRGRATTNANQSCERWLSGDPQRQVVGVAAVSRGEKVRQRHAPRKRMRRHFRRLGVEDVCRERRSHMLAVSVASPWEASSGSCPGEVDRRVSTDGPMFRTTPARTSDDPGHLPIDLRMPTYRVAAKSVPKVSGFLGCSYRYGLRKWVA